MGKHCESSENQVQTNRPTEVIVSVLVAVYNEELHIEELIKSVLLYEGEWIIEFIFIDDQSTDKTYDVISRYVGSHNDKKIRIILEKNNSKGKVNAYNKAFTLGRVCSGYPEQEQYSPRLQSAGHKSQQGNGHSLSLLDDLLL